jgi:hypothetical protein
VLALTGVNTTSSDLTKFGNDNRRNDDLSHAELFFLSTTTMQCQQDRVATPSKKDSKSVAFAQLANMRPALHINNYTEEEHRACYYSRAEFRVIKEEIKRTALAIEWEQRIGGEAERLAARDSIIETTFTSEASQVRRQRQERALTAVLKEQKKIFDEIVGSNHWCDEQVARICADERIALVYSRTTREDSLVAAAPSYSNSRFAPESAINKNSPKSAKFETRNNRPRNGIGQLVKMLNQTSGCDFRAGRKIPL